MIGRHIDGGLHEDIDITNNSQNPVRFNLEIAIRADFADIFEVKSDQIVRRGRITTSWSAKRQALRITYRNKDFCREVIVRTGEGDGEPTVNANGRLSFDIALKAGTGLASLPDLRPDGRRETHQGAAGMHPFQRDVGPCREDGRVAAHGSENQCQQRGILSLL